MTSYQAFHKRSIEDRNGFWGEQAELIHWNKKPEQIYDFSKPPFVKWFVGGETNLCYNAVDRHAETNPDGKALAQCGRVDWIDLIARIEAAAPTKKADRMSGRPSDWLRAAGLLGDQSRPDLLEGARVFDGGQVTRVAAFGQGLDGAAQHLAGAGLGQA